ncbi:selenocysteine-specific translation elongation factor [Citricoccus sp. SGAir0253]|uniref:selenocysteine-specific translation elongation factor n=1 Tax=Citricoccus sp. SGAir0253 TaxID=2567881 RepID=UPI0010CCCC5D|nr:selenocysteine-specific translation elongation factor [Citricoccus sp. SGAir0253]QCU77657.1 selenocysteine-specific translation elongation factor [Citricoccus sp. SGAir0253]
MHVVATAGHVDHGKSTLVRALTGMEPDRWAEERRRGLTIDLGFAWTALDSGREVAFVDVPGHERFLSNMLAGLGPAPVVCFVVAADEGWKPQSSDHRDAVAALGIEHGLVVLTRADLVEDPDRIAAVLERTRAEIAGTGLAGAPAVVVSAATGAGLDGLRTALDGVLAAAPAPPAGGRVRLWVDRSFTVRGAGAVATGTLAAGTLAAGDRLELLGVAGAVPVTVRALHSRNAPHEALGPVNRVAVNLRGADAEAVHRGDALVTPGAWPLADVVDVRRTTGTDLTEAPAGLLLHVGTATVPVRVRPFDAGHARLTLDRRLPLVPGDRLVLRDPGARTVFGGVRVLDVDPPALVRRGDGTRRARLLAGMPDGGDALGEIARRGAVRAAALDRLGLTVPAGAVGVRRLGEWWLHEPVLAGWRERLRTAVEDLAARDPLAAGLSRGAALDLLAVPDPALLDAVVAEAGLAQAAGFVTVPGPARGLGPAEAAVAALERRLAAAPFAAPEGDELAALRLGSRELAAAERVGRLLRLEGSVVLLPTAPALAMRELARLAQPFTTSQARQALGTSRRVAIPLLELLDARGWTRRIDAGHREVVR